MILSQLSYQYWRAVSDYFSRTNYDTSVDALKMPSRIWNTRSCKMKNKEHEVLVEDQATRQHQPPVPAPDCPTGGDDGYGEVLLSVLKYYGASSSSALVRIFGSRFTTLLRSRDCLSWGCKIQRPRPGLPACWATLSGWTRTSWTRASSTGVSGTCYSYSLR